ncbi:hypothetical protein NDU88_004239 [Pleurodeles waltl]|uniref:Uncharacterized protein n=1 Tax=Pleurodeles waltl TaxID=8319 RepID=A0AAV7V3U6_PLEWA|nr:hypothetical protein NDU88_004239 [Pleurodeles waltl]
MVTRTLDSGLPGAHRPALRAVIPRRCVDGGPQASSSAHITGSVVGKRPDSLRPPSMRSLVLTPSCRQWGPGHRAHQRTAAFCLTAGPGTGAPGALPGPRWFGQASETRATVVQGF